MKRIIRLRVTMLVLMMLGIRPGMTAQVTLQPWTQVYGTTPGQSLGRYVNGITPSANLPYKASIFSLGNTGLYTLQAPNDTGAQRLFVGSNMQTGDLNGDGRTDVVVRKSGGSSNMDTIVIYWGTSTGIDTLLPTKLHGLLPQDGFGASMCIGNLIGDSTPDLVIGSPQYPPSPVIQGRVYTYRGGNPFDTIPAVTFNGDSARYTLGTKCAIGDMNNDGYNDLVVRGIHQTTPRFSYVDIWFGSAAFDTTRDIRLSGPELLADALACFDANSDGIADLLWTAGDSATWVYIHYGKTSFNTVPSLRLQNPGVANFGNAIIDAGDMSGDGNIEIAVAASQATITSGFVFIFEGGKRLNSSYDAAIGMSSNSDFGRSVFSVGDVSGDGSADIIIGAPNWEFGISNKGYWGIFKGDPTITVVSEIENVATFFTLYPCYPNPFNPRTTIRYRLNESVDVNLEVVDMLGKQVAVLVQHNQPPGEYHQIFDGTGFASGIYFYKLTVKTKDGRISSDTKKLTLIK
jgi:hypothetical protein